MSTANIDPIFALAILQAVQKGLDAKVARQETKPGVYRDLKMELSVELKEMRVAPDTDKTPTASIPLLATCALLLKRGAVTVESLKEVLVEALKLGGDARKDLLEETGLLELEKQIKEEILSTLPRTPVKGAVTVDPDDVHVVLRSMSMG